MQVIYCPKCGKMNEADARFCCECGAEFPEQQQPVTQVAAQPVPAIQAGAAAAPAKGSSGKKIAGLIIGIVVVAAAVVGALFATGVLPPSSGSPPPAPVAETSADTSIAVEAEAPEAVVESEEPEDAGTSEAIEVVAPAKEEEEPVATEPPVFNDAIASSECTTDEIDSYGAGNAIDGDESTAWVTDGASTGDASGQWIELSGDGEQVVSGVRIMPGFCKSQTVWSKNRRPAHVTLSFSDGSTEEMDLENTYRGFQAIDFDKPKKTTYVRITIDWSYPPSYNGRVYDDCGISEIRVV